MADIHDDRRPLIDVPGAAVDLSTSEQFVPRLMRENVRAPVHLNDRDNDALPLVLNADLQQFIFENSTIRAMRLCSRGKQCRRRICPWCSRRVATATRHAARPIALQHEHVLELTFTTESSPAISQAWANLAAVRARFLSHGWLSRWCSGWIRETEVTHSPAGWHVHDHVLIFAETKGELQRLQIEAPRRWLDSARYVDVQAYPAGQHAKMHDQVLARLRYVAKPQMRVPKRGLTSGRTLGAILAGYKAGLAEDAELWGEVERLFSTGTKRRWKATGGAFRGSSTDGRRSPAGTLIRPEDRQLSVLEERAMERREREEREAAQRLAFASDARSREGRIALHARERDREQREYEERIARYEHYRRQPGRPHPDLDALLDPDSGV